MAQGNLLSDLQTIPKQTGVAVLREDGEFVTGSGDLSGFQQGKDIVGLLHDAARVTSQTRLRRLCVTYDNYELLISIDGKSEQICVLKRSL